VLTPDLLDAHLNNFAMQCFRDIADGDYIAARMAFRADLIPQALWASEQAIEKYLKAILLLRRVGCGLRRSELANLTMKHVQQRDNRWCIVDLVGKHGRVRTVPMPSWVKNAIDAWMVVVGVSEGHLFRPVNRADQICGKRMSEKVVWQMLKTYVAGAGLPDIAPHDLRRTTAKLCRAAGGELEQIQLLLGHSSVQTTERYLGTKQDLAHAPNDAIKLKVAVSR
jgi:integrase